MKKSGCYRSVRVLLDNWRRLFRLWVMLGCCWFISEVSPSQITLAQETGFVSLTIQLRYSDGSAVSDEPVVLQRLPDFEPILPSCRSDGMGRCSWSVTSGLYQLQFARPLDEVSALALAEGGLSGLGITVGETPVIYHLTFYHNGRVYFDAAPEADIPQPIIPTGQMLHGGVPQPTPPTADEALVPALAPTATAAPSTAPAVEETSWHLLLYVGGGILVGLTLYLFSHLDQLRRQLSQKPMKGEKPRD